MFTQDECSRAIPMTPYFAYTDLDTRQSYFWTTGYFSNDVPGLVSVDSSSYYPVNELVDYYLSLAHEEEMKIETFEREQRFARGEARFANADIEEYHGEDDDEPDDEYDFEDRHHSYDDDAFDYEESRASRQMELYDMYKREY